MAKYLERISLAVAILDVIILLTRIILRKFRGFKWDAGDRISGFLILINIAHAICTHYMLEFGGAIGVTEEYRLANKISVEDARRRASGGKLILALRTMTAFYLWGQKSVLFLFYRPLIRKMRFERSILISIWTTFGLTLLAVIVATWAECNPVWHYWITKGLNDTCFKGNVQLYVQGVTNITTDLMLFFLPMHVLFQVQRPLKQKVQLGVLFSLGIFVILTTAIRLQQNSKHKLTQANRSTWANAEYLSATIVAAAPAIYVALRPKPKPSHYGTNASNGIHVSRSFVIDSKGRSNEDDKMGIEVTVWTPDVPLDNRV